MAMKGVDEEDVRKPHKRVRFNKLTVIVPLIAAAFFLFLCAFLGVRSYAASGKSRGLQAEMRTAADVYEPDSAAVRNTADNTADNTTDNTTDIEDTELYTPVGVKESKRTKIQTDKAAEEEQPDGIRNVYLTFDDGPSSNTDRILDILAEYDVKATFFVVGKEEEIYQPMYKRIVEEGHTLAMHSYSHKYNEIYQSVESYAEDLSRLQEFLYDTTGVWCRCCRFPGGSSNTVSKVDMHELISYLDDQDISYFDWNISSGDASSGYIAPDSIVKNCTAGLYKYQEAIILMHDAAQKDSTVEALPRLIETIQAMENTRIVPITDDTKPIHHMDND